MRIFERASLGVIALVTTGAFALGAALARPAAAQSAGSSATPPKAPAAQAPPVQGSAVQPSNAATAGAPAGIVPPGDYVIGPDDELSVVFWRDKEMSADVVVRPDGKITLPLLNDIAAAGLTPQQLRIRVTDEAKRYVADPNATIIVRTINSRKVFITGQVEKPGPYPLKAPTTVLQLISMAGGLKEYADGKNIVIMRTDEGRPVSYPFNYKEVMSRRNLKQNIELKPGDTVLVP